MTSSRAKPLTFRRIYRRGRTYTRVGRYRSPFEAQLATCLEQEGCPYEYESMKIEYVIPASRHTYTPDFVLPNGIMIEAKGEFSPQDRRKIELVKEQHPDIDLRIVFMRAQAPIYKGSKTTCAKWCEDRGIPWANKRIPREWLLEGRELKDRLEANMTQKEAILEYLKHQPITPLKAQAEFGVWRLASIIHRLRREGHKIITIRRRSYNKRPYAEYFMAR